MASSRADEVAEILWELKRADKISTFTLIARRAGFSAGNKGRAMLTTLKTVRRDWPHLHWWRAVGDEGIIEAETEHLTKLQEAGYEFDPVKNNDKAFQLKELEVHVMTWEDISGAEPVAETAVAVS
jgi:alkylated DNA nucleotide flippase Atl1